MQIERIGNNITVSRAVFDVQEKLKSEYVGFECLTINSVRKMFWCNFFNLEGHPSKSNVKTFKIEYLFKQRIKIIYVTLPRDVRIMSCFKNNDPKDKIVVALITRYLYLYNAIKADIEILKKEVEVNDFKTNDINIFDK